jgi:hypothetical protein
MDSSTDKKWISVPADVYVINRILVTKIEHRRPTRCELLRDILGHANIDVIQNIFARAGGMREWMRDMAGGGENANCCNIASLTMSAVSSTFEAH